MQYLEARGPSKRSDEEHGVHAYKIGPPHALDLDWFDLLEDVREDIYSDPDREVLIDV